MQYTGATEGACYHMTLPTGQLVVGVGNAALVGHGIITRAESYQVVDDSKVHPGTEKCKAAEAGKQHPVLTRQF